MSEEERDKIREKNLNAANTWISEYIASGYSEKKLSECEKMTLNRVALITKVLMRKPDLPIKNLLGMPDPFFYTWQKTFLIFRNNIGNPSKITEQKEVNIENYLDKVNTLRRIKFLLKIWNPDKNDNFTFLVLYKKIPEFLKAEGNEKEKIEEMTRKELKEFERSQTEPKTDRMVTILYIAILFIREFPHKILIFIYVSLVYRKNENIDWDNFIRNEFSKTLSELYNYINKQDINEEFNSLFRELYGDVILRTSVSDYFNGKKYTQFLKLTGRDKHVGDVILRTFFDGYYDRKSGEPDCSGIKVIISQWVSRIKFEAQYILTDNEKILDLNDITKIS